LQYEKVLSQAGDHWHHPFVFVPEKILNALFEGSGKTKGPIRIKGTVNDVPYRQTLVKYSGEWRLYINTIMLASSPKRIGETLSITIALDIESREVQAPPKFLEQLNKNKIAKKAFESLPPSRRNEIVRYLANLKTESSLDKNIKRALAFLTGKERFVGRDKP
jgi:Bacteriocin-protection, YdeI or OmpD-Associated/Domain of unknown function (DUF1905)